MLIKNQESGLTLPPAPEFGVNGLWPPVETEWLPLRWELFEQETSDLEAMVASMLFRRSREPVSDDDVWFKDFCTSPSIPDSTLQIDLSRSHLSYQLSPGGGGGRIEVSAARPSFFGRNTAQPSELCDILHEMFGINKEIRQLVHSVRWVRKDPVTQLPPDVTHEMMHTVTMGLSIEHSQTLAESLGLDLGGKAPGLQTKLSYKIQEQFGLKLNITKAEEVSTKLTLSNPGKDCYRVFALWQVDHRLSVKTLKAPLGINDSKGFPLEFKGVPLEWRLCNKVEFMNSNQPFITYADVSHQ